MRLNSPSGVYPGKLLSGPFGFPDPSLASLAPRGCWILGASQSAREMHLVTQMPLAPLGVALLFRALTKQSRLRSLYCVATIEVPESSSQVLFPYSDHQPARSVLPKRSHPLRTVRLRRFYGLGGLLPREPCNHFSDCVALRVPTPILLGPRRESGSSFEIPAFRVSRRSPSGLFTPATLSQFDPTFPP